MKWNEELFKINISIFGEVCQILKMLIYNGKLGLENMSAWFLVKGSEDLPLWDSLPQFLR